MTALWMLQVEPSCEGDTFAWSLIALPILDTQAQCILNPCAGTTALCFRLAMKLMDYNLMATITALMAPFLPDFKKAMQSKKTS